jgi:perosamine synthetase
MTSKFNSVEWWSVETGSEELANLDRVIRRGFPNEGPETSELEIFFREYFEVKNAILTTSGTIAIYLALKGMGIGPGHRVGVPNLTFIATANAVSLTGAEPVLLEVIKDTLCLDPKAVEDSHKTEKLNAVIPVHVSGRSALNSEMLKTLKKYNLPIIEDAAEAFASKDPQSGKLLGTIGAVGAFSFSPNKIITSGQGGLVITNDDVIAGKIRELKDQGRPVRGSGGDDIHHSLGFNFKFTDLQAAVLKAQIKKLPSRISHLSEVYSFYNSKISNTDKILKFDVQNGEFPLWPEYQSDSRNELTECLDSKRIGYRKIWHPLSTQMPYRIQNRGFPISDEASKETLWLPSAFSLKNEQLRNVVQTLNEFEGAN